MLDDLPYLSYWLLVVAALRSISVVSGYRGPLTFQQQIFSTSAQQVTPLAARTFAIWTLVTSALAALAAFHTNERGMMIATALSFYVAAAYFTLELVIFRTVRLNDWAVVVAFIVAITSAVWVTLSVPKHTFIGKEYI